MLRSGQTPEAIKEDIMWGLSQLPSTHKVEYFKKIANILILLDQEKDKLLESKNAEDIYLVLESAVDNAILKSFSKLATKKGPNIYLNIPGITQNGQERLDNILLPGTQEILDSVSETLTLIHAKFKTSRRFPEHFPITEALDFNHEVVALEERTDLYNKIITMYRSDRESDYGEELAGRDEQSLTDLIKQGKITAHVYKKDSDIGCFILSEKKDNGDIYLFGLTSAPLLKKSGIPTFLFNELFMELNKEHTLTGWVYETNKVALNFYKKAGAEIVEKTNDIPPRLILRIQKRSHLNK